MSTFGSPYGDYPPPPRRPAPRGPSPLLALAGLLVLLLGVALSGWLLYRTLHHPGGPPEGAGVNPNAELRPVTPPGEKGADEKATIQVYKNTRDSVVHISTFALRRDVFNRNVQQIPEGTGSGFVWDKDGHVVTNYHVIQNADAAQVTLTLEGGKKNAKYYARVVGVQPDKDLAVLWINAPSSQLRPIPVGSSKDLQVGQDAFAIGNPFGLDQSLTKGIISARGREIESVAGTPSKDGIQTDAAINPGNSGGPLLDSSGRLIGVNTAIYSPSGANAGIGFAIPVDVVNPTVTQLIRTGQAARRPRLGVQVADRQFAREQGVESGALIIGVVPGSPAEAAGLRGTSATSSGRVKRLGDVIVAIDGEPIRTPTDLFTALGERSPGDTVVVTYLRDGERRQVKVKLQAAG